MFLRQTLKLLMMTKQPLDFNEYKDLGIDPQESAYIFIYENLTNQRISEIEEDLTSKRFRIIKVESNIQNEGLFKLKIIAIEPKSFTF